MCLYSMNVGLNVLQSLEMSTWWLHEPHLYALFLLIFPPCWLVDLKLLLGLVNLIIINFFDWMFLAWSKQIMFGVRVDRLSNVVRLICYIMLPSWRNGDKVSQKNISSSIMKNQRQKEEVKNLYYHVT